MEKDGAKFLVVKPPEFFQVDPDWQERFIKLEGKLPASFSTTQFDERLRDIGQRNHIPIAFLAPYFQAYRDAHHLRWPYFSLTCDPHYSALGHEVAAEAIVQELEEDHLLPPPSDSRQEAMTHEYQGFSRHSD